MQAVISIETARNALHTYKELCCWWLFFLVPLSFIIGMLSLTITHSKKFKISFHCNECSDQHWDCNKHSLQVGGGGIIDGRFLVLLSYVITTIGHYHHNLQLHKFFVIKPFCFSTGSDKRQNCIKHSSQVGGGSPIDGRVFSSSVLHHCYDWTLLLSLIVTVNR